MLIDSLLPLIFLLPSVNFLYRWISLVIPLLERFLKILLDYFSLGQTLRAETLAELQFFSCTLARSSASMVEVLVGLSRGDW